MKGIIYTRVSSEEQVKGTSLEFQDDACRKYAEQKGIDIVAIFREEGESAKDFSKNNRKAFLEALEYCRKHKGEIVAFIVLRVDRFARNTEDHFAVRKILLDSGTSLHSVTEPIGNAPSEKFIETVLAGAAEYDNAIKKQRTLAGMGSKLGQGLWTWRPPTGYRSLRFKKNGEKKTGADVPDGEVFKIIQRGLRLFAQEGTTPYELLSWMDSWGLAKARGRKTLPALVGRILNKHLRFYAGYITDPWSGEEIKGQHKPMITEEEYRQIRVVQGLAPANKPAAYLKQNPDFPLRGLVRCAECNTLYTASSPRGKGGRYLYYHCRNKECARYGKSIKKKDLEDTFMELLGQVTPSEEFLRLFEASVIDVWKEKGHGHEEEAKAAEIQLENLKTRLKSIKDFLEDGTYSREDYRERKAEIDNQIIAAKVQLNETNIDRLDVEAAVSFATQFISDLGRQWFDTPLQLQIKFQKRVFPEGLTYHARSGFGTPKLGLVYQINQTCRDDKTHLVAPRGIEPRFPG